MCMVLIRPARRNCRKLWRRPHDELTDPDFTLCWPPEVRSRPTAAGSARIPSRRPRNQSPFVTTAWPRTPGSFVVLYGRIKPPIRGIGLLTRKILWAFGWRPALQESEVADTPTLEPMMLKDVP